MNVLKGKKIKEEKTEPKTETWDDFHCKEMKKKWWYQQRMQRGRQTTNMES